MKEYYRQEWSWFKANVKKIFLFVLLLFFLVTALSFLYLHQHQDSALKMVGQFMKAHQRPGSSIQLFAQILLGNVIASFLAIVLGWIPFLFLPVLSILVNGALTAAVFCFFQVKGFKILSLVLAGIAPHGVFEIPAFLYSVSLGFLLCGKRTRTIFKTPRLITMKNPEGEGEDAGQVFKRAMRSFLWVILPLLFIAALVETSVTPLLMKALLPAPR